MESHLITEQSLKMGTIRAFFVSFALHLGAFFLSAWLALRPFFLPWFVATGVCAVTFVIIGFLEGRIRLLGARAFYSGLLASIIAIWVAITFLDVAAALPLNQLTTRAVFKLGFDALFSQPALVVFALSATLALALSGLGFFAGLQASRESRPDASHMHGKTQQRGHTLRGSRSSKRVLSSMF
jgi:hypothetical protein